MNDFLVKFEPDKRILVLYSSGDGSNIDQTPYYFNYPNNSTIASDLLHLANQKMSPRSEKSIRLQIDHLLDELNSIQKLKTL